jgi:TonB family protein
MCMTRFPRMRVWMIALFLGTILYAQDPKSTTSSPTPSQTPTDEQLPKRVRISQGVSQGLLLKKVQPEYPKKARKKHVQGSVLMQAVIGKNSDVTDLHVISGDELLAPSAVEAVKQWKYKPYLLEGEPVEVETKITVNYVLSQ